MRRILIPIDFSESSVAAARTGMALAVRYGSEVTLLHALDLFAHVAISPNVWDVYKRDQITDAGTQLEELKQRLADGAKDVSIVAKVVADGAAHAIVDTAKTVEADLVVMGSYGAQSGQRFLLGSVAVRVAQRAPCPVLITRTDHPAPTNGAFQHPMVAIDYSKFSIPAVEVATEIAAADSVIEMVHVFHWPGNREDLASALGDARAAELDRLKTLSRNVDLAPVRVAFRAEVGVVTDQILEYVASSNTDVVVVGAHGSADETPNLGSVADRVLRGCAVPVVVLPEAYATRRAIDDAR